MLLSQKYEERVQKFSFFARHHLKVELHRYIYIVISGKHLLDCISVYLDPRCIVSLEDFQHKILNWSTLPLMSLHKSRAGKRGLEL